MSEIDKVKLAKFKAICENPVLWAKAFLRTVDNATKKIGPWTARWYQAEMLLDKSDKKVARCGRRCLPGWDKILDPDTGELKTVDELFAKKTATVATMDSEYKMKSQDQCPVSYNGEKEVFRVTLKSGKVVDATGNHPLFTANGWKEVSQLKAKDFVATPSKLSFFGHTEIDDNDIKLLAYMLGDGNCKNGNLRFSQAPTVKQLAEMDEIVQHYGCELHHYDCDKDCDFTIRKIEHQHDRTYKNTVKETLLRYGVYGHGADDKEIPREVFMAPKRQVSLFLSRLYSTDGWASIGDISKDQRGMEIGYCSNSEELARGVSHLLLRYGIRTTLRKKKKAWIVDVYDKTSINIFAKEIGIFGKESAVQKVVDAANKRDSKGTFMPFEVNAWIKETMREQHVSKADIVRLWDGKKRQNDRLRLDQYKLRKPRTKLIADYLHMDKLSALADGEIEWDEIKSIKSLGVHKTYDFTVPNTHNFVVNDVITHNTGKTETMCVESLWRTNTKRSYVCLYVAPYEAQIRMIFNRITELINLSPAVKDQVVSNTKTPFEIKFKNGSAIRGFTTGASSGGGATSVRGQRADELLLDESDYMADADFDSVLAVAGEREGIKVFLSSTPTGARKRFWQCCTDPKMHFKEFHFPSMCNPQWSVKMEEEFRAQLSEQGYVHEILAEFGTQETGVFDKDKLDAAMRVDMYAYAPLTYSQNMHVQENHIDVDMMIPPKGRNLGVYRPTPFRTLGVDWDKYCSSSSLLVLDYLPSRHMFKVVRRVEVPRAEYSFDAAVNLIIALNQTYNPSFIYADAGSGEYQIEMLHKYGDMHPETGLKNKVKRFQFSQKIDVMDPVTHIVEPKPMKPFMVNQLAMCIERQQLILSPFDETLHKQLVDYEVIRQSANGQPVFTDVNEHFVDALGLAFLAFALEFPDLTKTIVDVDFTAAAMNAESPLKARSDKMMDSVHKSFGAARNPWSNLKNGSISYEEAQDPREVDKPHVFRISSARFRTPSRHSNWGSRGGFGGGRRGF